MSEATFRDVLGDVADSVIRDPDVREELIGDVMSAYHEFHPPRDHAAAEAARRDDLARDVARLWAQHGGHDWQDSAAPELIAALYRLHAAYLPDGPKGAQP